MDWQDRIVADPAVAVGKPVVKGTRLAVEFVVGLAANGIPHETIAARWGIAVEDVQACLRYAQELVQAERVWPLARPA